MSTPEQYIYVARLVPLNQELPVVDPDEGPIVEYFDSCAFAPTATRAKDIRLLIDHDDNREAGHFTTLRRDGPWLLGTFVIDFDTTPGVNAYDRLELGTPISIGFTRHTDRPKAGKPGVVHRAVATLDEASIVDQAAYKGAEVIHKWPMRAAQTHRPPHGEPLATRSNRPRPRRRAPRSHLPPRSAPGPPPRRQSTRRPMTRQTTRQAASPVAMPLRALFRLRFSQGDPCHEISPRSGRTRRGFAEWSRARACR